jgi:DNA-binding SARP family transcriptional activator
LNKFAACKTLWIDLNRLPGNFGMKQTILSKKERPLLTYAISKLNPEVFSHPVWVRFSRKEQEVSSDFIDNLAALARKLQDDNPSDACQLMLVCAVYQNYAGQPDNALTTLQQVLVLAQRTSLVREILWANWGACAICVQNDNYEQAISHLGELQVALSQQNEWVLADFVEMLKQFLVSPVRLCTEWNSEVSNDPPFDDLVHRTFIWLQQWGFSAQDSPSELGVISRHPASHVNTHSTSIWPFFSIQRWQDRWHTFMLATRGELKLLWAKNDAHPSRNIETQVADDGTQTRNFPPLPPAKESSPSKATAHKKKLVATVEKVGRNQGSAKATTVVPIAVHMLGTFGMMIGDLTVKLPLSRGLSLLKYLLLHHKQNIPREVLMDVFWPDADPETARNDLNVTVHSLRKALRNVIFLPVIVFTDGAYGLEPSLQVWLDVEEFEKCVQAGQRLEARNQLTAAVAEYESAISLYQGDFLEQTPYEEWTVLDRERLRIAYLNSLDRLSQIYFNQELYAACIAVCQLILNCDRCREDAHCFLMRCYSRQGQYHLALRQYQICVDALRSELEVDPAPETKQLYERIRRHEQI